MLRHDFRPGRLLAGLTLATAGALYLGDAQNAWDIPWFVAVPVVTGGFFLAAVASVTSYAMGRRGARKTGPGPGGPGTG